MIITNPIWVAKTRLCLQYETTPSANSSCVHYKGMSDALSKIYKFEGFRGLYKVVEFVFLSYLVKRSLLITHSHAFGVYCMHERYKKKSLLIGIHMLFSFFMRVKIQETLFKVGISYNSKL